MLPEQVTAAQQRASAHGFTLSCDPGVGRLLAVLAAAVPADGRILELGTGTGVGTAWLAHGMGQRDDVVLDTVEREASLSRLAQQGGWPAWVRFLHGDALEVLLRPDRFDLIFADAQGGKWQGLDRTIAALAPGGVLVVDDMTPQPHWDRVQRDKQEQVRGMLMGHPALASVELGHGSGVILSARRHRTDR